MKSQENTLPKALAIPKIWYLYIYIYFFIISSQLTYVDSKSQWKQVDGHNTSFSTGAYTICAEFMTNYNITTATLMSNNGVTGSGGGNCDHIPSSHRITNRQMLYFVWYLDFFLVRQLVAFKTQPLFSSIMTKTRPNAFPLKWSLNHVWMYSKYVVRLCASHQKAMGSNQACSSTDTGIRSQANTVLI